MKINCCSALHYRDIVQVLGFALGLAFGMQSATAADCPNQSSASLAQATNDLGCYSKVLLPIAVAGTPGGYGSVWSSVLFGRNNGLDGFSDIFPLARTHFYWEPGSTMDLPLQLAPPSSQPGQFIFVPTRKVQDLHLRLVVADISKGGVERAIEIPVVTEKDVFESDLHLIGIPSTPRVRYNLRIYSFEEDEASVNLKIFDDAENLLKDDILVLRGDDYHRGDLRFAPKPAYAEYSDMPISVYPHAPNRIRNLRIQISPTTPNLRFWAFLTITDNQSQHVTTVRPRP